MTFRFRLAQVLKYRERERDECARAVKTALDALRSARDRVRKQELAMQRVCTQISRTNATSSDDVRLWQWQASYLARSRASRDRLVVEAGAAREKFLAARERLQAAHRECEKLHQLETRQRTLWLAEQRRRERVAFDEIAAVRAASARQTPAPATGIA
jgi:flagellar export protein FliJ